MKLLSLSFDILTYCGVWRVETWSSYKNLLYNVYMVISGLIVNSYTISQAMDLILIVDNADDFAENVYTLLPLAMTTCKMYCLTVHGKKIRTLIDTLMAAPCAPDNEGEQKIQDNYNKRSQLITKRYLSLVQCSAVCNVIGTLMTDLRKRKLGFRAWVPFDYNSSNLFYVVYFHQLTAGVMSVFIQVATDTLICGFILQICSQIEILKHRVESVTMKNKRLLHTCVYHHDFIYSFSETVNNTFMFTIFCQFVVSTFLACFSLYQMAKVPFSPHFLQISMYLIVVLSQIFYYCYWGNELKFKSLEIINTIFGMDWVSLDNDGKLTLLMMMKKAMTPIEFMCAYVINMNLESFVSLVKTSYSVYNLLEQTSGQNKEQ